MKKLLLFAYLFLATETTFASVVYYPPPYYNPYMTTQYFNPYYPYSRRPVVVTQPNTINDCPLQPAYYDANGNWVAPQRICSSPNPKVNIQIGN